MSIPQEKVRHTHPRPYYKLVIMGFSEKQFLFQTLLQHKQKCNLQLGRFHTQMSGCHHYSSNDKLRGQKNHFSPNVTLTPIIESGGKY